MGRNSKSILIYVIAIFAFIMLTGGVSYAYFIYNKDVASVSLDTGEISLSFSNASNSINNITLLSANDDLGKILPYYIDFTVTGVTDTESVYYEIYMVPNNQNTTNTDNIRLYLSDQNENSVSGRQLYKYLRSSTRDNGKIVYSETILANANGNKKTTTKNFRLRLWNDVKNSPTTQSNFGFSIYLYARNEKVNMMDTFPTAITDQKANIKEIYFQSDTQSNIDTDYNNATIKADLTYNNLGNVKAWLTPDTVDNTKYIMYVKSDGPTYLNTGRDLFLNYTNVEKIDFSNVDTSFVQIMTNMFNGCSKLANLDISGFNTTNVTNMYRMFYGCSSFQTLDVTRLNTFNVKCFAWMFCGCSGLTSLDVSNFDPSNGNDGNYSMIGLFSGCTNLSSLTIGSWNCSNVVKMTQMFVSCSSLTSLDLSGLNTNGVTLMNEMFKGCSSLTSLDLSNFNTSSVTNMSRMFHGCTNLVDLNISSFDTSSVSNMSHIFIDCKNLVTLDLSSFNVSSLTTIEGAFGNCIKLETIYVSNTWNLDSNVTSTNMFNGCNSLSGKAQNMTYAYNSSKIDGTMAVIATDTQEGYLTDISLKPSV